MTDTYKKLGFGEDFYPLLEGVTSSLDDIFINPTVEELLNSFNWNDTSKVVVISPTFRQSKLFLKEIEALCQGTLIKEPDCYEYKIGQMSFKALPLNDKLRGVRLDKVVLLALDR